MYTPSCPTPRFADPQVCVLQLVAIELHARPLSDQGVHAVLHLKACLSLLRPKLFSAQGLQHVYFLIEERWRVQQPIKQGILQSCKRCAHISWDVQRSINSFWAFVDPQFLLSLWCKTWWGGAWRKSKLLSLQQLDIARLVAVASDHPP